MRTIIATLLFISSVMCSHALVINEVMSNPTGDDGGREWIELYNDSDTAVDITGFTVSIKGGSFVSITPVSGGTSINPQGYAIIGSTVSGATRFTQDYGSYNGPLFKSSISLVNTGVTSIEIKLNGVVMDSLPSYTAAKEGLTYSRIGGAFVTGAPTPGEENKAQVVAIEEATTSPTTGTQLTIPQMSPPSANIVLYLPSEKTVIAGAPSSFSVYSLTREGKSIDAMSYVWSFGDGGERTGATTTYRYFYPGRYVVQVEGSNGLVAGTARMVVRVVPPEITMSTINQGRYGAYIDITNPNAYDLDISGWKLSIDGALFSFPRNTILAGGTTHVPGVTMGFASTTISSSTLIKLLFPSMDEVLRVPQEIDGRKGSAPVQFPSIVQEKKIITFTPVQGKTAQKQVLGAKSAMLSSAKSIATTTVTNKNFQKDTRLATFIKSLFGR